MKTEVLPITEESLQKAREIILAGGLVAFPTETVYGLGANALDAEAVRGIFAAKGRPSDNPLIVHVGEKAQIPALVREIPAGADKLMDAFMPGPITVVMPKKPCIPDCVTGGIDTVGIRLPEHPGAQAFLRACGVPIAAPSANTSGKPSPTTAAHVLEDMDGRIPLILDGGPCTGGVESTVISLCGEKPLLLRPGLVSHEMLESVLGEVRIHPAVLENGRVDRAASPGMKYKHYSPKARVLIVDAPAHDAAKLYDLAEKSGRRPVLLWHEEALPGFGNRAARPLLSHGNSAQAAQNLFALLRQADEEGFDTVLITAVTKAGAGLSVMNRMLRAAAFTVISSSEAEAMTAETLKNRLTFSAPN